MYSIKPDQLSTVELKLTQLGTKLVPYATSSPIRGTLNVSARGGITTTKTLRIS
jgi:hypothetical protein